MWARFVFGLLSGAITIGLVACSDDSGSSSSSSGSNSAAPDGGTNNAGGSPEAGSVSLGAPTFTNVYGKVLSIHCTSCHGVSHETGLAMADRATAYANLVGAEANGAACRGGGRTRVLGGDLGASLLWNKVSKVSPDCGSRMPLTSMLARDKVALIQAWIEKGAPND